MRLVYDATGRKWFKHGEFGVTGYASGIEYLDGKLEAIYAPDGRMVAEYTGGTITRYRAEYFHQDHPDPAGTGQALGNTRLVFSDFNPLTTYVFVQFLPMPATNGTGLMIVPALKYRLLTGCRSCRA